jgi:hypothetical protein
MLPGCNVCEVILDGPPAGPDLRQPAGILNLVDKLDELVPRSFDPRHL